MTWIIVKCIQVITYINDMSPNFLVTLFAIQYTERVRLIYMKLKQRPNIATGIGSWLTAILDFFPFIFVAHVSFFISHTYIPKINIFCKRLGS